MTAIAIRGGSVVLTGRALAVQQLRQHLKTLNIDRSRVMTKAYWAPGKMGLD
jgi:NADPH-dependent ferric siderophore reductase